jgi:Flp pilus assembly protein TadD
MGEKRVDSWVRWEQFERRQGVKALSRLADDQLQTFFADSVLAGCRLSRLPFYSTHRLVELRFARDHGEECAFVLAGPTRTWWLNGESNPIHDVNEAEPLKLTQSLVCDYIRFFFYFVRGDEGPFVLIESADEVEPQADVGDWGEEQDEWFEAARNRARPLRMRGRDEEGRWLVDATVAYAEGLFEASLAVAADGNVEMLEDEPVADLAALAVPAPSPLALTAGTDSLESEETTDSPELTKAPGQSPTQSGLVGAFGQSAGQEAGTGELFVGRAKEQGDFRQVLDRARSAIGDPDEGHVVLVHGLGGIGKSTLLCRLHEIAGKSLRRGPLVADIVDCGDNAGPHGLPMDQLLYELYAALKKGATDRHLKDQVEKAFKDFRATTAAQQDLLSRASQLGIRPLFGHGRMSTGQAAALEETATSVAQTIGTVAKVTLPHIAIPAGAAIETAGAVANMMRQRRDGPVDSAAYSALLANLEQLVSQFARALKQLSRSAAPVVLFIDTAELLDDKALKRLRQAAKDSGSTVVWVLGMRLETAPEVRHASEAARFRADIRPTRLRSMPLTNFDAQAIEEYLHGRLGDRYPKAGLDITAVASFTRGVPLAVSLIGQRLADGQDLATVLAPIRDDKGSSVITDLVEQILVYTPDDSVPQADRTLLYGLALRYGDAGLSGGGWWDPDALAALWDVPVGEVANRLDALARRHDFVLSGSGRLHQDVQEAVLVYLLDRMRRPAAGLLSTRAAALYRERATTARQRTVDEQLADQDWQSAVLSLLWHTFWIDLGRGLQLLKALFAPIVIADASVAAALLRAADFFAPACPAAGQRLISELHVVTNLQLTFRPALDRRAKAADAAREVVKALKDCPEALVLATTPSAAAYYDLLQANCHEALSLTVSERAALLLRAATHVEPGTGTAREIAFQVSGLAINVAEFHTVPAETQQTIVSALNLLTRFTPDDATAHHDLGNTLFALGQYPEAEAAYRVAIHLNPSEVLYRISVGTALVALGRHAEAEASYGEALRLSPANAIAIANLGNTLYGLGQYRTAEAAWREALRLEPSHAVYHYNLGATLSSLERYTEAEAAYREALLLDPSDADFHDRLGDMLFLLGRHAEAEAAYREALRLDPENAVYHCDLGNALFRLGRYDEAAAAYREAARLDPSNADAHNSLGKALAWLGRYAEAEAAYREALRLDPSNADAHDSLGRALAWLDRYAEAEAAYREALRLDPSNADVHDDLGTALTLLGRYAEAEAAYHEAAQLDPSNADTCNSLGRLYLTLLGRIDEAEAALREALRLDPNHASAHANLGSLYVVTGELDAARSSFLQATQSGPAKHAFSELMLGALDRSTDPSAAEGHFTAALATLDQPLQQVAPFERAEIRALAMAALDRGQEATAVFEGAVSKRSGRDVFRRQHYELFSTSGLTTGIDALIAIWRDIIASDNSAAGPWGGPRTLPHGNPAISGEDSSTE